MPYVLLRTGGSTPMYVAPPGQERSYTKDKDKAQQYGSLAQAKAVACGNERAVAC